MNNTHHMHNSMHTLESSQLASEHMNAAILPCCNALAATSGASCSRRSSMSHGSSQGSKLLQEYGHECMVTDCVMWLLLQGCVLG